MDVVTETLSTYARGDALDSPTEGYHTTTAGYSDQGAVLSGTTEASLKDRHFSPLDYCLFSSMLIVSAFIGVYFAFFAKQKQNTTSEYLRGGKNMGIAPVAMSLIASYVSGITLLGVPGEVYRYGTQFSTITFGALLAGICGGWCFLPVFYTLQLNSSYQYLSVRFDRKVELLGSFLFCLTFLLYIPVVIYVPALAINQVTGVSIHLITPIVCLVCIFYTSLGGIKAVVWTDALQIVVMFGAIFVIVGIGNNIAGGFATVWQRNKDTQRIEFFKLDMDLTTRHTFWNTAIACSFNWLYHCTVNQSMVQRFLVMPTVSGARLLILISYAGIFIITNLSSYIGLQIFAIYYDCDRLSTKIVGALDQLLPYFVMDVAGSLPGLPGLFMAGVFSAALSSMSTGLNSMSGVIYEDFICTLMKVKPSEERASFIMKLICVVIGVFCVCSVVIVEHLEGVITIVWTTEGISSGPMLSLFVMGLFIPWANSTGVFIGGIAGLIVMGVICLGNQFAISSGRIQFPRKPISLDGCAFPYNSTDFTTVTAGSTTNFLEDVFDMNETSIHLEQTVTDDVPWVFRISYTWYCMTGLLVSMAVGLVATAITGPTDLKDVHIDHLSPAVHRFFRHRCKGGDRESNRATLNGGKEQGDKLEEGEVDGLLHKKVLNLNAQEDSNLLKK